MSQNSAFRLRIPDEVASLIRGLHPELKKGLRAALADMLDQPYMGKPLREELAGLRSMRVKRFRIIYRLSAEREIQIVAIGPRRSIYTDTYRALQRDQTPNT